MIDNLVQVGVYSIIDKQKRKQKRINTATGAIIVLSTIIYLWSPLVGLAIDTAAIIMMTWWYMLIEQRRADLFALIEAQKRDKPARRRQFCKARFAQGQSIENIYAE